MSDLPNRIRSQKDLTRLLAHTIDLDHRLAKAHADAGPPFYRKRSQGFESLLKIMVEQQLSRASADAIWGRLQERLGEVIPEKALALSDEHYRSAGLSRPKIRYARALAEAIESSTLNLKALSRQTDEQVMANLCAVTGIGRWTAEIYMLFCLGRPNVWLAGDVAVQAALQMVHGLEKRPDTKQMDELAQSWQPVRGIAALILWQFYRHIKNRPVWV